MPPEDRSSVVDEDRYGAVGEAVVDRVEQQGGAGVVGDADGARGQRASDARVDEGGEVSDPGSW